MDTTHENVAAVGPKLDRLAVDDNTGISSLAGDTIKAVFYMQRQQHQPSK
jgi:hypothetical protein